MEVQTFTPTYPEAKQRRHDPEGVRVRIRHDLMDAAEKLKPEGVSIKAYLNQKLAEVLLGSHCL
jgi:hypothetical protein